MATKIFGFSLPVAAAIVGIGYFLTRKAVAAPAPVNGLGYMPNTTLSYGPLYGDVVLDNTTMPGMGGFGKSFKKAVKKVKKVAKKAATKSPGLKVIKAIAKHSPAVKLLNKTPIGKLVNKSPIAKLVAPKAKAASVPQTIALTPSSDDGLVSYTDIVSPDESGSGQSFTDPNISYSSAENPDPTQRFDTATDDSGADDASADDAAPTTGGGAGMAIAAAATAGAFLLFRRH